MHSNIIPLLSSYTVAGVCAFFIFSLLGLMLAVTLPFQCCGIQEYAAQELALWELRLEV